MVEDVALGVVEVAGVAEVEGEADDNNLKYILHKTYNHILYLKKRKPNFSTLRYIAVIIQLIL